MKITTRFNKLFSNKKFQAFYVILLITIVPAVIVFNSLVLINDFQETIDVELHRKALLTTEIIDALFDDVNDMSIQENLIDLADIIDEVDAIDVMSYEDGHFRVLASTQPELVGDTTSQTQYILAWQRDTAIAHETNSSNKTTLESSKILPKISSDRFIVISKPIYGMNGQKTALVSMKFSSHVIDELISRTLRNSYIILILTVALTLVIIAAIAQFFRTLSGYKKRVDSLANLKSKFIEVVSHQLRTPLNSIRWNLELLLNDDLGKLSEEMRNFISATHESNQNIIHTVQDLITALDIERKSFRLDLEDRVSLKGIVLSVVKDLSRSAKVKSIKINVDIDPNVPEMRMDAKRMQEVVYKLLDNAIKYSNKKSEIDLSVRQKGEKVIVEVADHGVGIPKDEQDKIFLKFFRGRNASTMFQDASGLGLFIVKNIVQAHDGEVSFESKEGEGTVFRFTLAKK